MKHIIVYTTAHVFEVDTVREAFTKGNIPFYVQSESLGGVRTAFEASPAAGLGRRWHFFVPSDAEVRARKILSTLRLTVDSDSQPFFTATPASFRKNLWKAILVISPVIALLAYGLVKALANH
jgi:hypothetical protein